MPTRRPTHSWAFTRRIRKNAFGWKSSALAIRRLREAVTEVRAVARRDPLLGAEGAVGLLERMSPAFESIDSSAGALGSAASRALDELVVIVRAARPDAEQRARWLERLFEAIQDDGVGYLQDLGERFGELCGTAEVASEWAAMLQPALRDWAASRARGWFSGASVGLSALVAAGKHDELFELLGQLERPRGPFWPIHRFGVQALAAQGRIDAAIVLADEARGGAGYDSEIDATCEHLLLDAGRWQEAWQRYGVKATQRGTYLATFRAIAGKYPELPSDDILRELIANSPGDEGRWFATAVALDRLALAAELARRSPTSHETALRAARKHAARTPEFALDVALSTLGWLFLGRCRDASPADACAAAELAVECTELAGRDGEATVHRILELAGTVGRDSPLADAVVRLLGVEPPARSGQHPSPPAARASSARSAPVAPGLPPGTSVSKTFLDFLEPIVGRSGATDELWRSALVLGQTVWNSVVLEDTGRTGKYLNDARRRVAGTPQAALVEFLIAQKRNLFRDHQWLVGDCEMFVDGEGEHRLRVEARSAVEDAAGEQG